jgi:hypothetical protein
MNGTHAEWLERNLKAAGKPRSLTDDESRCVEVLASIARLYNLHTPLSITESIEFSGGGLSVLVSSELATYDDSALTRLVLAAHEHAVRVAIAPWLPHLDEERASIIAADFFAEHGWVLDHDHIHGIMEIRLSPRSPGVTDQCWDGHPTLADLASIVIPAPEEEA